MIYNIFRLLVVDDMMTMRKIVMKACRDIGFQDMVEATDGQLAWTKLTDTRIAPVTFIISDWNMPNATGLDLLKRVRADGRYKNLPFILLTAESESAQVVEALKAGVDNYVVKPFDTATLKAKIDEALTRSQTRTA